MLWHSIIKVSIWKCEKWTSIHETSHCDQHVKHRNCWKKWRGEEKKFGHLKKLHLEAKNSDLENEFLNEKKKNLVNQFLMKSEINFVVWHSLKYIDVCQKKFRQKVVAWRIRKMWLHLDFPINYLTLQHSTWVQRRELCFVYIFMTSRGRSWNNFCFGIVQLHA